MRERVQNFQAKSTVKSADKEHRRKINFNIGRYNAVVPQGKSQFSNLELARKKAKNIKWKALNELDRHLETFEKKISARGVKVIWAEDTEQALVEIGRICKEKECKSVVKSKSMVTEEIHLNKFLGELGIESIETDLGEYIQQLDGEPPYHIVTPAMHKSKEDVARLFAEKLGTDPKLGPEQLTLIAREKLRKKYREAEVGITGANFIIAASGSIAISENEGNARLSSSWPRTHIVIAGIEKIIPSLNDLSLFWPLLSTYGTGQKLTVYNTIISGPRMNNEKDGPEEMIVILLDNGRTNLLEDAEMREALYCIRCGACLNACPVYKNIGGHSYQTTYSGPIGSVITPQMKDLDEWKHLSYASSLCGNCTEVCPVRINIHELLLVNRRKSVDASHGSFAENWAWRLWKRAMLSRKIMNLGNKKMKDWVMNVMMKKWRENRETLEFPSKSFNQLWKEKR